MSDLSQKLINGEALNLLAKQLKSNIKEDLLGNKKLRYITLSEYESLSEDQKNDVNIVWNIIDANIEDSLIIQVDWSEQNPEANGFIKNKPELAPSDAQKNSDITKAEIEAKLTGDISSHTHAATMITEDSTHRFVTDAEKTTWNGFEDRVSALEALGASSSTPITKTNIDDAFTSVGL